MIRAQYGIVCKGVVIDYLQLIPVKGSVATERAIAVTKAIKELAKELRVAPFLLSQVPKELAGDGNEPLPMQAPKDSGEITNLADKQINCWRPNRARFGVVDNIFTIQMAKDRHGRACYHSDLKFDGERYRIDTLRPEDRVEKFLTYPEVTDDMLAGRIEHAA
jgi:replicative DNA helicase